MKKYNILFSLILFLSTSALSQVKVGANILPGISVNRISSDSDTISFSNDGVGYRIALGILFDFETKKNYYFSTGIYWFPERVGIKAESPEGVKQQSFNLQYLQIPLNFKLLTDEFSIDKWFFFQFGLAFEMKIDESGKYSDRRSEPGTRLGGTPDLAYGQSTRMDRTTKARIICHLKISPNSRLIPTRLLKGVSSTLTRAMAITSETMLRKMLSKRNC